MAGLPCFGICRLPPGASNVVALQEFPSGLLAEAPTAALSTQEGSLQSSGLPLDPLVSKPSRRCLDLHTSAPSLVPGCPLPSLQLSWPLVSRPLVQPSGLQASWLQVSRPQGCRALSPQVPLASDLLDSLLLGSMPQFGLRAAKLQGSWPPSRLFLLKASNPPGQL